MSNDRVKRLVIRILAIVVLADIILLVAASREIRGGLYSFGSRIASAFIPGPAPEEDYWYVCPMHTFYKKKLPGECGICGMTLVKKHASELKAEESGVISLNTRQVQLAGITSKEVKKREVEKVIDTYGRIDYDERAVKLVTSWISGRIDRLYVDFTGVDVKKGAPLAWLYSPELITTQREYLLYVRALEKGGGERDLELQKSIKQRLLWWGIKEEQIEALEKRGEVVDHLTIHSPEEGIVIEKMAFEGMYVKEGSPLFRIAPLENVWLYADIYEYEIPLIKPGQEVEIRVRAMPQKVFKGKVSFIDPFLNPKTRTVRVRCDVPNPEGVLRPDMYADARIKVDLGEVLAVPEGAVMMSGKNSFVFVDQGDGLFEPRPVKVGARVEDVYEVVSGLEKGERVVTSGNFLLSSESQMRGGLEKILSGVEIDLGTGKKAEGEEKTSLPEKAFCSLDGMEMNREAFQATLKRDGETLYFCSEDEMKSFERDESPSFRHYLGLFRKKLDPVLTAYLVIRKELAGDAAHGFSRSIGKILNSAREALSIHASSDFNGRAEELKGYAGALIATAESLKEESHPSLEKAREVFGRLSDAFIPYLLRYKPHAFVNEELYLFGCSMAGKRWVQETPDTENPYFGSSMLTCGERITSF